jgi:AraC-like DNA-binding protein
MKQDDLEIVQYHTIEGLSIFFNCLDYRTPHLHPEWELIWVLDQPLWIRSAQELYRAEPGEMLLFNPFQPHEIYRDQESCTFLCLQIMPQLFSSGCPQLEYLYVDDARLSACMDNARRCALQRSLLDIMEDYLSREPGYELRCMGRAALALQAAIYGLPHHLLSAAEIDARDRRNARLSRLIRYVDENYAHRCLLEDFAQQEGCTLNYMSAFVRETISQPFQKYVSHVRFNAACRLMAEGKLNMQEICVDSGFSDYRYFARAFRERTGMTPEEYRSHPAAGAPLPQEHHSLHTRERFLDRHESMALLKRCRTGIRG